MSTLLVNTQFTQLLTTVQITETLKLLTYTVMYCNLLNSASSFNIQVHVLGEHTIKIQFVNYVNGLKINCFAYKNSAHNL